MIRLRCFSVGQLMFKVFFPNSVSSRRVRVETEESPRESLGGPGESS